MDEKVKMESKLSSAAAFVEGGVQDACDDACSICLEAFCDSDPSTVTSCKHEYHLQCILEWCQRSSQCPMCWQPISMKDHMSQELLEAVEQERKMQANRSNTAAVFHHPVLGDFQVPAGADDAELEERIIQHLAAAAAMRRSHRHGRRDGHRSRSGSNGRPQIVVFSTNEVIPDGSMHASSGQDGDYEQSTSLGSGHLRAATDQGHINAGSQLYLGRSDQGATDPPVHDDRAMNRISENQSTPVNQDTAGPSDLQSFSDTLRSRWQSASTKYKDSITKSTRGWKEKWFSRSNTISDIGSEVRREVNAGIAVVSRMMERLETRDGTGSSATSTASSERETAFGQST
ncbi:hypothetical protein GUJ93_ZPchr0013g36197 [Zizania palustris]|uniref:RING-type E3 ubiquitin transferase n=2 Tax=Zizania palustris TaxID=103762 RepID=A0A8J6BWG2_ZIZPA|nr:hypothetical protein GUJ93_ZPchr0013g36197 [Zizania palustris]KAG8098456.1 hypothetical protein GUJ93_ZPchr0013g36197 [Zizania palustris]KAG8098457.1 hypothetical protein GUJ93_ZPchr0013g36197 [Zizania palustris]